MAQVKQLEETFLKNKADIEEVVEVKKEEKENRQ